MTSDLACIVAPCAFWHRCEKCERVACWTTLYGPYCGLCLLAEPPEDFGRASSQPIGMEVSYLACDGKAPQVLDRCQWPAMSPKDEKRLRGAYFSRPPYWIE